MCGIIGYIGEKTPSDIILDGLKRLEYRGYDSAGLAISNGGILTSVKEIGKVERLVDKVSKATLPTSGAAIGHTRWATHGGISEANAHPHFGGQTVAVVHNGIIDNWEALKSRLIAHGAQFASETDTEVVAHLLAAHYDGDAIGAIEKTLAALEGTYALGIIFHDRPGTLYFARNGSPLIIGLGQGENFISSDPGAICRYTNKVIYIEDKQYGWATADEIKVLALGKTVNSKISALNLKPDDIDKAGHTTFMSKEIWEQPAAVRRCLGGRVRQSNCILGGFNMAQKDLAHTKSITLIGCGTSYYAGLAAAYTIESLTNIPTRVELASELAHRKMLVDNEGIYLAISQSGETYDTIECIKELQTLGAKTFGIVNGVGSSIARLCGAGVYIHAGPEVAVASTKAFTAQVTALQMLAITLGRANGSIDRKTGFDLCRLIEKVPDDIQRVLEAYGQDTIKDISVRIASNPYAMFLGSGSLYPVALEGALKLKEISYVACDGLASGEMKHGPIAMISKGTPVIVLMDENPTRMASAIKEVEARGADVIPIKVGGSIFSRIHCSAVVLQRIAMEVATLKNLDVDRPRNLAKAVVVG